jgi:hypothetical protein
MQVLVRGSVMHSNMSKVECDVLMHLLHRQCVLIFSFISVSFQFCFSHMPLPHFQRLFLSGTPLTPRTDRCRMPSVTTPNPLYPSPLLARHTHPAAAHGLHPDSTVHPPQRPGYLTSPLLPMLLLLLLLLL